MKKIVYFFLFLLIPFNIKALSNNYQDKVYSITNSVVEDNKVNLYLFHGKECPHCEEEREWLENIKKDYADSLNVYLFEVWHDSDNRKLMDEVRKIFDIKKSSVPLTVIGDEYYVGFSTYTGTSMENKIKEYLNEEENNDVNLPILGNVNVREVSLPLVAVILGFVDGFNPCAMWILLFLINMLFTIKNKKKAWILGLTFLFISAFVYFLSMLGINLVVSIATINWMKIAIAIFILIAGLYNLRKYFKTRKEVSGCSVVNDKKRKKLISKMKMIIESKSFILSILGIILLATSVNLIELACSLGFPLIFTEMLAINEITGITKIIYLLIYIFFYMIDDMVVFIISMISLEATGITNKYSKLCTLISAIIMILIGLLLLFKPDWLMLNF